ncbi:MAG TPA: TolC family protein [Terriglobales bacterium]|nr:TolC family protein [Terriglobales bacterium]
MAQTAYSTQPSATSSVSVSIPASISQRGFTGSVPEGKPTSEVIPLSFADAIDRGLKHNLGLLLSGDETLAARGAKWKELSNLLPDLEAKGQEVVEQESLAEFGFKIPGLPTVIGPFNYLDMRAYLTQSIFNWNYIQKERAAALNLKAAEYTYRDARELVVLVVGNAYLEAIAGAARVETVEAQVRTAQAVYDRAVDQQKAGVSPAIDTLRSRVELQNRQQQLIAVRNDYAKRKLSLSRLIGLPLGQEFSLSDRAPYEPLPTPSLQESLERAYAERADYQAARAQLRAAELSRKAATAEYYPTFDLEADYGDVGVNPANSNGTFHVVGTITVPIFQAGKARADSMQAEAALRQAQARAEDLRGQIDNDVRTALLDLNAAADQVEVARSAVDLAEQTLTQAQDRFAAGVTDTLEVVQAQESVASAHENYISSLYAHNLAKVEYARAIGYAEQGVRQYLKGK